MNVPLKVPCASVKKCDDEEHGIKVWNDASGTNDSAPSQAHEPVGDIVGLAAIFPPTTGEKTIAEKRIGKTKGGLFISHEIYSPMCSLNKSWILNDATGKLGERFAELSDALRLHLEPALLRHGAVPDVIRR